MMPLNLKKEVTHMVIQHFQEEHFNEAARVLGRESGLFFDLKYFEETVFDGNWDEAENYLSGFTKVLDNSHSIKIYFELRKQKYFEALDKNDRHKALDILLTDLKVFSQANSQLMKDLSHLLTIDNIRQVKPTYQDANFERRKLMFSLKEVIAQHPLLRGKLARPIIENQRLRNILNNSLKWQKQLNPSKEPDLLVEHESSSKTSTSPANSGIGNGPSSLGTSMEWTLTNGRPSINSNEKDSMEIFGRLKPNSTEESDKKSDEVFYISEPSHCQFIELPKHTETRKIEKLVYTNAGNSILALQANGVHLVWLWPRTTLNSDGKVSANVPCQLWQPKDGTPFMTNDLTSIAGGTRVSCLAISKRDGYLISSSGGKISLFNMVTFKTLRTFMSPPPSITCVAFYPEDNNIFAIGFEDSTILIYHIRDDEILVKLEGHSKSVAALAFSNSSKILVSSGEDAKITLWSTEEWEKLKEKFLQVQGNALESEYETQIEFQPNTTNFLFAHQSHLAIYESKELTLVKQWLPEVPTLVFHATFSASGHAVYSLFGDGSVAIFDASNLQLCCRVRASSYLSPIKCMTNFPNAIAAHPQKPYQFALGLSDGSVFVFEPRNPVGDWIKNH